ncbi:MAG: carbohydrate ABC transporter substrate-binding protein [Anaerolineales bacterium]|nr:carbohydrate ABC transporter substrate-binding protein [Anaerolineales bacterium]
MLLAGCAPAAPTEAPAEPEEPAEVVEAPAEKVQVEVFSWWTTGGEANGLQKLMDQFNSEHENAEVFNAAVAGGAGSNAKAVLKTRMLGGDPPDSFQVHMGHELIDTWVTTGYMEPLDDVFETYGLNDAFPQGVLDIVSYDGHPWSVPVNIHRSNVLWYNKTVFADNGIEKAPETWDEFIATAEILQAAGITPLALGDNGPWAAAHLFEDVLAGVLGADGYKGLWTGDTSWSDAKVTEALNTFRTVLSYVNEDHSALTWDQANQYVIDGKAAMTIMGDWCDGDYVAKGFTDYGWAPVPGTKGVYVALSDTFGLPKGAKNPELTKEFLGVLGSKEGQEAFNILKGSICARTDCDYSAFDEYLQSSAADWQVDTIVPSVIHGAAASEGWVTSFTDAIAAFVTTKDVAAAQDALIQAAVDAESGQAAATVKKPVEVFSWWTTGGEATGLQFLIDQFNSANPEYNVYNSAVAGGAGSNAKAVLKTRMLGGDPPDSFQVHMGHELIDTWVTTGFMEPLDDVYSEYGLNDVFPQGVLDIVSYDGHPWSVPVNIHRSNVLWYNKTVFEDNGIDPASLATFDGWQAAAEKLKAAGITPLALGDNGFWVDSHLFESVLAGTLGAEKYSGLWTGTTDWNSAEVTEALENFKMMVSYANSDHSALSWDQANQLVIDGKAAMTVMGDWCDGDYVAKSFTDYGWAPPPGTKGIYIALSDTFGLPKGVKQPEAIKKFLGVLGSKEGQEAFNKSKGSICARMDCDYSAFDAYLQSSAADWQVDSIVPSLAHGAAASEGWVTVFNDTIGAFVTSGDVASTQTALVIACQDAGVCK